MTNILLPTTKVVLPLAARTATNYTDMSNPGYKGLAAVINVTAGANATDYITFQVRMYDPSIASRIHAFQSGNINSVAIYRFVMYPGATSAGGLQGNWDMPLPENFSIWIGHATAASITYSVGIHLLP